MDDSSTTLNNNTISLHISAYENSIEADTSDSLNKSLGKSWLIKEQKQITHASTFICQNPFELTEFKASHRLINSNEVSNNVRGNGIHKNSGYRKNDVGGSTAVSMHYQAGRSRSQTILNTSHLSAAPSHYRSVWRHQIHQNSWLCSLISPKVSILFFL
uniref:Uncharacterized protein n=1 Tax=Panagrolaimus sp. PS1159 TaxID=55785 RepID=A0AC35EV22_9BILA